MGEIWGHSTFSKAQCPDLLRPVCGPETRMKLNLCLLSLFFLVNLVSFANSQQSGGKPAPDDHPPDVQEISRDESGPQESDVAPVFLVADGLNADGSLIENYQRGLNYAVDYFGNYGPYYIYLLSPGSEQNIREIFRKRAGFRVNPMALATPPPSRDIWACRCPSSTANSINASASRTMTRP